MQKSVLLLLFSIFSLSFCAPDGSEVTYVPGFSGSIPFKQYAGYFTVNDGEKNLFYWFVESQNNPSSDPVLLWLNGGPGCSSFDGFIYEHGPFFFNDGPTGPKQNLTLNPYSWNMVANVIYLDSPCGVGLSYSNNPDDYNTDDKITARDSHQFLLNFFAAFPEFAKNDFYIAGESYAGVYVPTLAEQVYLGNSNPKTYINIKGILVGNGVTDQVFDGNGIVEFIYGHGLINIGLYNQIVQACNGNYWNATGDCSNYLGQAFDLVSELNVYDIYEPCYGLSGSLRPKNWLDIMYRVRQYFRDSQVEKVVGTSQLSSDVPCIDSSRADAWLNQDSVRKAIHAVSVAQQTWTICSDQINYTSQYSTVLPIYTELINGGFRVLVYSGDVDMCVPYTGSEMWTRSLNLSLQEEWRPWTVDSQVAGYVRTYSSLTYATIKGSGHTVPEYKPKEAFAFFSRWISGQPL